MSSKTKETSGGVGVLGLLGVLFIALKLTHYIDWPWLWVLAPLWGGFAVALLLLAFMGVITLFALRSR